MKDYPLKFRIVATLCAPKGTTKAAVKRKIGQRIFALKIKKIEVMK